MEKIYIYNGGTMKFLFVSFVTVLASLSAQVVSGQTIPSLSQTGFIVTGTPESLTVSIDDSVRGITPLTVIGLSEGEHSIVLTKKGFYGKKITATAMLDSVVPVEGELRAPASLTVVTSPDSALLFINRKKIEKTPFTISPLRPDTYTVMLLKAGFSQFDTTITLESGSSDTLKIAMKELTTTSTVQSVDSTNVSTGQTNTTVQNETIKNDPRKKRLTIIASAICVAFLAILFVSEFTGSDS